MLLNNQSLTAPVFFAALNSFLSCSEFISVAAALIAGVRRLTASVPDAAADGEKSAKLFPGVTGVVVKLLIAC